MSHVPSRPGFWFSHEIDHLRADSLWFWPFKRMSHKFSLSRQTSWLGGLGFGAGACLFFFVLFILRVRARDPVLAERNAGDVRFARVLVCGHYYYLHGKAAHGPVLVRSSPFRFITSMKSRWFIQNVHTQAHAYLCRFCFGLNFLTAWLVFKVAKLVWGNKINRNWAICDIKVVKFL